MGREKKFPRPLYLPYLMRHLLHAAFILAIMFMILALMLPFQLKFGGERGRIALIVCLVLVSVLGTLAELIGIDLATILDTMPTVHAGILAAILLIVALLLLGLSCLISIGIVQKKEF